jgi:hypothetical protein
MFTVKYRPAFLALDDPFRIGCGVWGAGLPFVSNRSATPPRKTELGSNLVVRGVPVDLPRAFCVWASEVCRIAGSVWLTGGGGGRFG